MRTLKCQLNYAGVIIKTFFLEVALFLMEQLEGNGRLHGYKLQHLKCIQTVFVVSQTYKNC